MHRENYIQQGKDTSCQLVALLNAFIYKFGMSPVEYKSKEFKMLVEIGRGVAGPLLSMREIFMLFGIFTLEPPAACDLRGWIESRLKARQPVSFPIVSPTIGHHQILIVGTEHMRHDLHKFWRYKCVNAQYRHTDGRVEMLGWTNLAQNQGFMSLSDLYSICWHDEEGVSRRLKHPQTYGQAVREYHHALKLTGFFPKSVKQKVKKKKRSKRRG